MSFVQCNGSKKENLKKVFLQNTPLIRKQVLSWCTKPNMRMYMLPLSVFKVKSGNACENRYFFLEKLGKLAFSAKNLKVLESWEFHKNHGWQIIRRRGIWNPPPPPPPHLGCQMIVKGNYRIFKSAPGPCPHWCCLPHNNNVHSSCAHQRPERSDDTYTTRHNIQYTHRAQSYQNNLHKVLYGNTRTRNDYSRNWVLRLVGVEILWEEEGFYAAKATILPTAPATFYIFISQKQ